MMDETRLQEIEARVKAASPGEPKIGEVRRAELKVIWNHERDMLIHAHEDVPTLIAAVRERDARIADLEQMIVDGSDRARRAAYESATRIAELEAAMPSASMFDKLAEFFEKNPETASLVPGFSATAVAIRKAKGE